jgi:hypothetical protein
MPPSFEKVLKRLKCLTKVGVPAPYLSVKYCAWQAVISSVLLGPPNFRGTSQSRQPKLARPRLRTRL